MVRLTLRLRRLADTTGTNVMEAALITPLLLILTFGIVDFAGMFYVWVALENGASVATRFAITGNDMADPNNVGQNLSRQAAIMKALRDATPTITIADGDFTFQFMAPGSSSWQGGTGGPNDVGRVTVQHTWTPLTPILAPFLTNGQLRVSVDSAMKNESRFQ